MDKETEKEFRKLLNDLDTASINLREFLEEFDQEEDLQDFCNDIEYQVTDTQQNKNYI